MKIAIEKAAIIFILEFKSLLIDIQQRSRKANPNPERFSMKGFLKNIHTSRHAIRI